MSPRCNAGPFDAVFACNACGAGSNVRHVSIWDKGEEPNHCMDICPLWGDVGTRRGEGQDKRYTLNEGMGGVYD
ncbi:hypothetical protein EYF80_060534 [Liparis tanakae]|uniref:Uncharacterized protein n=1 Tax=Liparis tanakae TaxID=230148 RepID=A0A4Z2EL81_9TELE|nr:hypothetical protein EYF80_060534 [Liparis tanakae]